MLEHLMADDLLSTYYTNALSFTKGNEWSGDIVKQMTLRYPQLDILEIGQFFLFPPITSYDAGVLTLLNLLTWLLSGAGTGSATRSILGQIKNQFSSYTFTDISSTFFPNAKQIFHAYGDKIVYRVLDAGRDVTDQGFTKHLYDVVVASSVLHATRCLEDTLRNVRSLLKPGGFLVLCEIVGDCPASTGLIFGTLPSWWVGAPEGRQLGPTVPPVKWASLLRQTGFSGIDSMTEHKYPLLYHVNVMVSQAVDDWVDFLRHPLWPSSLPVAQKSLDMDLVIIGGTTVHVGSLVVELQRFLRPFVRTISIFQSLDMVEPGGIPAQATVFSLAELDQPVFHDLTPASFDGLKTLFSNENAILWLTEGREDRNPKASMTAGFARSVLWEAPELHIQFIDLEDSRVVDSSLLATYLLRHHVARTRARTQELGSYLQSLEREIHVDQYLHESILRWEPLDEANDRFNSANRPITYQVSPRASHVVVDRD
jgi:hybrid polyketide synthase/nonribosomal peptide synthetase ACE1